jgi:hypothetical protein
MEGPNRGWNHSQADRWQPTQPHLSSHFRADATVPPADSTPIEGIVKGDGLCSRAARLQRYESRRVVVDGATDISGRVLGPLWLVTARVGGVFSAPDPTRVPSHSISLRPNPIRNLVAGPCLHVVPVPDVTLRTDLGSVHHRARLPALALLCHRGDRAHNDARRCPRTPAPGRHSERAFCAVPTSKGSNQVGSSALSPSAIRR